MMMRRSSCAKAKEISESSGCFERQSVSCISLLARKCRQHLIRQLYAADVLWGEVPFSRDHVSIQSAAVYDSLDTSPSLRGNLDFPALRVPHPCSIIVDYLFVVPIALVLESESHMQEGKVVSRGACP